MLAKKVSDAYTVPLCALCHHTLHTHRFGERDFWMDVGVDPEALAESLWLESSKQKRHDPPKK